MKKRYLNEFAETGLKIKSADRIGISPGTADNHFENDPEFEQAFYEAMDRYHESIREAVITWGRDGVEKPLL